MIYFVGFGGHNLDLQFNLIRQLSNLTDMKNKSVDV